MAGCLHGNAGKVNPILPVPTPKVVSVILQEELNNQSAPRSTHEFFNEDWSIANLP